LYHSPVTGEQEMTCASPSIAFIFVASDISVHAIATE